MSNEAPENSNTTLSIKMSNEAPENSNTTLSNNLATHNIPSLPPGITDQLNTIIQLMQKQTKNEMSPPKDSKSASRKMHQLMQGSLMVVAVLAAGATYQAGLSPPGGLWQADDAQGHSAGMPILLDTFPRRYKAFFYCNSVAFITSLVLIILLMNKKFYDQPRILNVLHITMVLDLFGFMGAYAAGSCRDVTASIVLFLLLGMVFIHVIFSGIIYSGGVKSIIKPCCGCSNSPV